MAIDPAVLVLEDGTRYLGNAYGARGQTFGEVVFATGMTGYQETLTDPSYAGQIVVMTAPHIGNTGVNDEDPESSRIWVSGYVVRDPSRIVSNYRATGSLDAQLVDESIVGISGIDTRAVTRRLRDAGVMRGGIFAGADASLAPEKQLELVNNSASMVGLNLSSQVSTTDGYSLAAEGERIGSVAVLDLGVKTSTLRYLAARGFDVNVVPQSITLETLLESRPDAVFYSNGPGDPGASDTHVELLQGVLREGLPFFESASATNSSAARSALAHTSCRSATAASINRSSMSRPVAPRSPVTTTGSLWMRRSARSRSLPPGFGRVEVSHVNLNDNVVEGLNALDIPAFSVQYHPEAAAGPHDANYLFDRFRDLVLNAKTR